MACWGGDGAFPFYGRRDPGDEPAQWAPGPGTQSFGHLGHNARYSAACHGRCWHGREPQGLPSPSTSSSKASHFKAIVVWGLRIFNTFWHQMLFFLFFLIKDVIIMLIFMDCLFLQATVFHLPIQNDNSFFHLPSQKVSFRLIYVDLFKDTGEAS